MTILDEIKQSQAFDLYVLLGYLQANFFLFVLFEQVIMCSGVPFPDFFALHLGDMAAWFWWISIVMGAVGLYMVGHMVFLSYFHPELEDDKKTQ